MKLQGERHIPASPEQTWSALNDPEVLKACIAGCESLERTGENEFQSTIALRIGPVNARFKGKLALQDIVPTSSYTIAFEGQGGVAGFGKGSAEVRLSPDGAGTLLAYSAHAQVGGKLAQVGSRLIDGTAAKIAEDFFTAFSERLAPQQAEAAGDARPEVAPAAAEASVRRTDGRVSWIVWAVAAVLFLIVLAYLVR